MKKNLARRCAALALLLLFSARAFAAAEIKAPEITMAMEPFQYAAVKGDSSQFRAHHWMSTGYDGGVKEFGYEQDFGDGVTLEAEGHAIPGNGDYGAEVKLEKEGYGYLLLDYKQFRKYYASMGGVYNPFRDYPFATTDKDLSLNIGEFALEAGLRHEDLPEITLNYAREFKQGTKSRLTWGNATEGPTVSGGAPDVARKIVPSWQEIDEIVDKFGVKAEDDTIYGIHWRGQQNWEYVRAKNNREEITLSNTPAAASGSNSDQKIRNQYTEPRSNLITSILGLSKWTAKDKIYVAGDYRFAQLTARELENIVETDQKRVPTNFSNAETVVGAYSDNIFTSNTWVGSITSFLWNPISVATRFKIEDIHRKSESTYPKDNSPNNNNGTSKPDGRIDQMDVSNNEENARTFGEGISLRYTGIPRTAIYNEYEFQQTRDNLYEDRTSSSAGEVFNRADVQHMNRGSGVLGFNYTPWDPVTLTTDVRHREDDIRYNHANYLNNSTSGAKSVFIDGQYINTDELSSRVRWRVCKWFQPSFRYQYDDTVYETWGLPDSDNHQESGMRSHTYTWDVVIQPMDDLLTTSSFSYQRARVFTPARLDTSAAYKPTYDADVMSALFSAEYSLSKDLVLVGNVQWSNAGNFNNLGGSISYGADYEETDASLGLQWTPKQDMKIEPKYSFFNYNPSQDAEYGGYTAHVVSVTVDFKWG